MEKSNELWERAERLRRAGKQYAFTLRLRSFIIQAGDNQEMLVKLLLAWGNSVPFYDDSVKAAIKTLMGNNYV